MAPVLTVAATVILARLPVPAMPRFALGLAYDVRRIRNTPADRCDLAFK